MHCPTRSHVVYKTHTPPSKAMQHNSVIGFITPANSHRPARCYSQTLLPARSLHPTIDS